MNWDIVQHYSKQAVRPIQPICGCFSKFEWVRIMEKGHVLCHLPVPQNREPKIMGSGCSGGCCRQEKTPFRLASVGETIQFRFFCNKIIKLLHLNMRKANCQNQAMVNNYLQPEDQDPLRNIPISYRKQFDIPNVETSTSQKLVDNKFAFLEARNYNKKQNQIEFSPRSPRVRDFLRHTTYVSKVEPMLEKKKSQLTNSLYGSQFLKKSSGLGYEKSDKQAYSNQSSPVYTSHLKTYGNEKYDKLVSKPSNTASFIEQLKRFKEEKNKAYEPSKNSYLTSETQRNQESIATNYLFDNGFRKKMGQDFYTPKPEPTTNAEKIKRGFTPNQIIKKVSSPSHKKMVTIQDFILETKLGGGKFGTVWKAFHVKTRSLFALKKIPKKMLKDHMMVDQFILEVKLQTYLKHQNILEIYGVFDDQEHVYLILEYMEEGTLYSELKKKKKLTENETAQKIKQITKAVAYMHENGIVHRDIKPENIVMSGGVCKLCDFGWATICQDRRKTYCGTFDYAAPQILEGEQYDLSVDLWCLGVLTYELMVGKAPFYHVSRKETISNILNVENKKISFPMSMSVKAISFINSLLKKNPDERPTYEQLLNHPFLKQIEEETD